MTGGQMQVDRSSGGILARMPPFGRADALRSALLGFDRDEGELIRQSLVAARGAVGAILDLVRATDTAEAFDREAASAASTLAARCVAEAGHAERLPVGLVLAPEFARGRWQCRFGRRDDARETLGRIVLRLGSPGCRDHAIAGQLEHLAGAVLDKDGDAGSEVVRRHFARAEEALCGLTIDSGTSVETRMSELLVLGSVSSAGSGYLGLPLLRGVVERELASAAPADNLDLLDRLIGWVAGAIEAREGRESAGAWLGARIAALRSGQAPSRDRALILALLAPTEGRRLCRTGDWEAGLEFYADAAVLLRQFAGDNGTLRCRLAFLLRRGSAVALRGGRIDQAIEWAEEAELVRRPLVARGFRAGVALYFDQGAQAMAWAARGAWGRVTEILGRQALLLDRMCMSGEIDPERRLVIVTSTERELRRIMQDGR